MNEKTASLEGLLVIMEDGEPVAVVRKNGANTFFKLELMSFEEIGPLIGGNKVVSPNSNHHEE
jgi:hypothetical protein